MLPGSCHKATGKPLPFTPLHDCAPSLASVTSSKGRYNRQRRAICCNQDHKVRAAADIDASKSTNQVVATSVPSPASEEHVKAPLNIQAGDSFEPPTAMSVEITAGRVPYSLHPQLVAEHTAKDESRDLNRENQTPESYESSKQVANVGGKAAIDTYTALLSKATIAVNVFHARCLRYWPCFAAANTILASELVMMPMFWQGACGLAAVTLAYKLAQFAVSCFTQGSRALFGEQQDKEYKEHLEDQLKSVVESGVHRLQPDSEEYPTPALQFFCSGVASSAAGAYITLKAAQFMNSYPGFEASSGLLSLLAVCNVLGLVCACLLCVDLAVQGQPKPQGTSGTPATA